MRRPAGLCLVAALAGLPLGSRAHETLHDIRRGNAVAVRAYFADGEVLAYTAYEIYSPSDPRIPYQKGRTDRSGWLSFVPDAPGRWRVKVIDDTGHGIDLQVEAAPDGSTPAPGGARAAVSTAAFVLRPLVGLAVIGAVFAALAAAYRRRRGAP